ncbi:antifreeze protein [Oceaniglobus indicus]|uniref:antifreeze protein n=1 Tax=Oceaniglobus indicus TaxID=2047749 RepID=UPI001F4D6F58|nr:antifreeze protein [Oceaniglobus indicus]
MPRRPASPFDMFATWCATAQMMAEAQTVIAYRMMGMAGLWSVAPSENRRMIAEKGPAMIAASTKATNALMSGKRPDQILDAAVKPLGRKTHANVRRLSKRGPRLGLPTDTR